MGATPEQVLRRMRKVIGTVGNERSNEAVARLALRALLFAGQATPPWRDLAACADMPPEAFYPNRGQAAEIDAAKRVCRGCPVRPDCLADVLGWEAAGRRHGIVAGFTPNQRERLMAARRREQRTRGAAA